MNILLTSKCNRRCPYCFAAERISYTAEKDDKDASARPVPESISLTDFETCLQFARNSRQRTIGLLGGEPSLHPEFEQLLRRAWQVGMRTRIFTNGLWAPKHLKALEGLDPKGARLVHIVLNINHPDITPDRERKAQQRFLKSLGRLTALSYNIYEADFDPMFLVDVVREYGTKRDIRLGVAQPLAESKNKHMAVEDYPRMAASIIRLMEACDENDIHLTFDCGFTLCMFTPEELGRLLLAGTRFKFSCAPVVDVGTDLSVWACFPLSTLSRGVFLPNFSNFNALARHFKERFDRLYRTGVLDECVDCRYWKRNQCSGGCAAHVYRRFNP